MPTMTTPAAAVGGVFDRHPLAVFFGGVVVIIAVASAVLMWMLPHQTPTERYLDVAHNTGHATVLTDQQWIGVANVICRYKITGMSPELMAADISAGQYMPDADATRLVKAAISAYCSG